MIGKRFLRRYQSFAVIFLNTVLLFVGINILSFIILVIKDNYFAKRNNPVAERYGISATELKKVYPEMSEGEVNQLLNEMWSSRSHTYEPYIQFKERPHRGVYLNIDDAGFRYTHNQGPWPPQQKYFTVFLFGGSTTFGAGVADRQTVASYLQDLLSTAGLEKEVRVYNFGQGNYYSTQERIFFERLLTSSFIPDVAVFIDGVNDFTIPKDEPAYTDELKTTLEAIHNQKRDDLYVAAMLGKLPVVRLSRSVINKVGGRSKPVNTAADSYDHDSMKSLVSRLIDRYLANKKIIEAVSNAYNVQPLFVVQPVPTYKYDLTFDVFQPRSAEIVNTIDRYLTVAYPELAAFANQNSLGNNFLWCADIQEGLKEPLYVDHIHYTAKGANNLAQCIYNLMRERNLLSPQQARKH